MNTIITNADSIINSFYTEYNACMIQSIPLQSNVIEDNDADLSNEELTLSIIPLLFEIDMDYTEEKIMNYNKNHKCIIIKNMHQHYATYVIKKYLMLM